MLSKYKLEERKKEGEGKRKFLKHDFDQRLGFFLETSVPLLEYMLHCNLKIFC